MHRWLVSVGLLALVATSAQTAGAVERPQWDEGSLAARQGLSAFGLSLGGLAAAGLTAPVIYPLGAGLVLATPYVVGRAVCGLGQRSRHYEGSCASAIGGAYLGALSMLPLAVIGYQLDAGDGSIDGLDGLLGAMAGMAVGWLVVQPLASTIAWHAFKRPRLEAAVPLAVGPRARLRAPESLSRSPTRGRAPGQMTLTLLSAGF